MISDMVEKYIRFYKIAEITIRVESDLPILDTTFNSAIRKFEVDEPGEDVVVIKHHFKEHYPHTDLDAELIFDSQIWKIYKQPKSWIYQGVLEDIFSEESQIVAKFSEDYDSGDIFHKFSEYYLNGNVHSLTLFNNDQLYIAQLLAHRSGLYLHSSGVAINGKGILFVGHSSAGKSTIIRKLMSSKIPELNVLCDDRNIVRKYDGGFRIHGTWNHGSIPTVSPSTAPLELIFILEKSVENSINLIMDKKQIRNQLIAHLVKGFTTPRWWDQNLLLVNQMANSVPCYLMKSDKSDAIVSSILEELNIDFCAE